MDVNEYDMRTYETGQWAIDPMCPYLEPLNESLHSADQTMQEKQGLGSHQMMSLVPSRDTSEHSFMAPQGPLLPQNVAAMGVTSGSVSHSGPPAQRIYVIKGPSEDDWERFKPEIKKLYAERTLNEVMKTMREVYKFNASTKMYKARINKWKFGKNFKSAEMNAIVRKQAQRFQEGKKSAFRLRDSQVSDEKIARYRKGLKLASEEQALSLRAATPPGLDCYTPLSSPLRSPREYEAPEQLARLMQVYVRGSFDSQTWIVIEDQNCVTAIGSADSLMAFVHGIQHAIWDFIAHKECQNTWRVLEIAMSRVEEIISAEDPLTMMYLTNAILSMFEYVRLKDLALSILRYFSAMSAKIKPQGHPFNQLFALFTTADKHHLKNNFHIAGQSQLDCFMQSHNRYNWATMQLQVSMIRWTGTATKTEAFLRLLRDFEHALGASDVRCLRIRLDLAWFYYRADEFKNAARTAQSTITLATKYEDHRSNFICWAHFYLALVHYKLSEPRLAEHNIQQAINIRADDMGWEYDGVLEWMSILGDWLEDWDRPDEAAEVRNHYEDIIASKFERMRLSEEERFQRWQASQG